MATKLNNITGQYHRYVEDQVLTHHQLNETIDYFNDQNRMQNVFLSGTGIACGFQVSTNARYNAITITQGTGITTDGDLIKLKKPSANELAQSLKQKLFAIDFDHIVYRSYKLFNTDKAGYGHFVSGGNLIPMWELLPEKPDGTAALENEAASLNSFADLKNHVVLLYLENYCKDASLCSTIDCSNQGGEEVFNLRVLLVSKTNAAVITGSSAAPKDTLYVRYDYFSKYVSLPELGLRKVIPTFNTTQTQTGIRRLFNAVVSDAGFKTALNDSISKMLVALNYSCEAVAITNGMNAIFTIDPANIPIDIHYRYDALKDVVATYKELKDLFIRLGAECNPSPASFPKHLLLGLAEDINYHKEYRHSFYKSPILDNQNKTWRNFDSLVCRLTALVSKYGTSAAAVKITPSKLSGKLGEKSIPYYYNADAAFLYTWDFEKSNIFMPKANFSYHTANLLNDDFITSPLKYILDDYDFYRVEGYLNDSIDNVKNMLNAQKNLFGLDFDFQILDIVDNKTDLKAIMDSNKSFEHKGGVKKGGTLLLLKEGGTFIADFAVDYKIAADSGLGCCTLIGCLYPWISTLRYINNLSRSLRGTQSDKIEMPTHYKLRIKKYVINGVSLINETVSINIPLDHDIFVRRLHVVMERLNTEFPTGLLFDFIEEEKKLRIIRLKDDSFEFEVQDVTLSRHAPTYKFTADGVTKDGKNFSSNKITCAVINSHRADVYKKIHNIYDPFNKDDDDFGRFNEDWNKWEYLRRQLRYHPFTQDFIRFPKTFYDFFTIPLTDDGISMTVGDELLEIADDIMKIDDHYYNIYIGGDWTSGNWVNPTMQTYYSENIANTNDDLVLFMNLRKKIHNEEKVSKYMIHIDTTRNVDLSKFETLFARYAKKAEFYFYKPANGNFIRIIRDDAFLADNKVNEKTFIKRDKIIKTGKKAVKPVKGVVKSVKKNPGKPNGPQ